LDNQIGLYKKGKYVKFVIPNIKYKHFKNFTADKPLVLARINPGEDNFGFVKCLFKKHRWYNTLLKSNDPIIISVGWRRF
jgi:ribosome biogenesis protein BMS1